VSVLGTNIWNPFHGHLGLTDFRHYAFICFSPLRYSTDFYAWTVWLHCSIYPDASGRLRGTPNGTGILTCFPFVVFELRYDLGSTNPRLTIIAEEPWPLRRFRFSLNFGATIARIFVPEWSTGLHSPASTQTRRLPTGSPCGAPWYRWSA